ncbi:unnamed protein product [Tilletia caries]|nr:unnamed protein product [Tilletia caries]CAD6920059.1 unnamed protein product [Tilletia controversa]
MSNYPQEAEFEQALGELTSTLGSFLKKNPEYQKALDIVQIPERIITFRVVWEDDKGECHVNRGYRVQFNSALGPYKGGLRFHPTVNLSILNSSFLLRFLGFEQIFKNALTGLPMGGAKGGADFDPKGKTDAELRRFTKAFATELQRHIGPNTDVPAGDIGQVAQFAALKVMELGGVVLSLSDSKGTMLAKDTSKGFTKEMIEKVYEIKTARKELSTLGDEGGALVFHGDGARPWELVDKYDIALPCATQNEMNAKEAEAAVSKGCRYVAEGSNMGLEQSAIDVLEKTRMAKGKNGTWYGPGKAANSGGVAVSGLEMAQNSQRLTWAPEEVDEKLKAIMKQCYENCYKTGAAFPPEGDKAAEELPSLVVGSNVAGFKKVADAMRQHGDWW